MLDHDLGPNHGWPTAYVAVADGFRSCLHRAYTGAVEFLWRNQSLPVLAQTHKNWMRRTFIYGTSRLNRISLLIISLILLFVLEFLSNSWIMMLEFQVRLTLNIRVGCRKIKCCLPSFNLHFRTKFSRVFLVVLMHISFRIACSTTFKDRLVRAPDNFVLNFVPNSWKLNCSGIFAQNSHYCGHVSFNWLSSSCLTSHWCYSWRLTIGFCYSCFGCWK